MRHWLTYTFPILGDSDKATRKRIHDAFGAWGGVLDAAFKSLNDKDDKTFDRWFPEKAGNNDGREYVKGVFGQLFDSSTAGPKAVIAGLINEATDVTGTCAKNAATKAYMLSYSGRFHICAPGLSQSTLPTDNKCKDLGNAVSTKMNMLTGTLVHEFMHYKATDKAPNSLGELSRSTCLRKMLMGTRTHKGRGQVQSQAKFRPSQG